MVKYHRLARLLETVTLIRGNRKMRPGDLAERFSISKKRVHDDIQDLCMAGIPIVFDENGYRILDGFFLPPTNYTMEEALTLILALHLVQKHGGYPEGISTKAILAKALGSIPNKDNREMVQISDSLLKNDEAERSPVVKKITEAIMQRKTLDLIYYSLNQDKETTRQVDGYAIIHRKHAWYLVGYCHNRKEIRIFKLTRIKKVEKTNLDYTIPKSFSLTDLLEDSWGVRSGPKVGIKIKFSPEIAPLIREKRFPNGVLRTENDGYLILEATTSSIDEVRWWVMQYGASAEVIEPRELREAIRLEVERMGTVYSGN